MANKGQLISYLTLRRLLGILGIFLPIILLIAGTLFGECDEIQETVSAYFHTPMRDIFVAIISSIALFLFTYKGYDGRDNILTSLAGLAALCVALFPTEVEIIDKSCMMMNSLPGKKWIGLVHTISAISFFILIMIITLFQFTKGHSPFTPAKIRRNRIYRFCGATMLFSIFTISLYYLLLKGQFTNLKDFKPVFWLESISLIAFGTAWLVKGETILKDKNGK